ncbi:G2 and S phase-expressed protein 1 isoform X1 [Ascaphus truei]|uniref:G2 and S phase-expressed protein 1 isoform X1 n=1 Tax=Ascaphus truei TaxID=8439 RepID=UPI003F5A0D69
MFSRIDAGGDFTLLTDEKFDFDISLSPTSSKEDNEDCDDEVFVGPVKHKEKCVSIAIQSCELEEKSPPQPNEKVVWSPLSGDKFVEIFKEAHLLALHLECFTNDDQKKGQPTQTVENQAVEKFVQDSKLKLNLFEAVRNSSKSPIIVKRETYCVQDSPLTQMPSSIQQQLVIPSSEGRKGSAAYSPKNTSPVRVPKPAKAFAVSPLAQKAKALQVKNVPVGNAGKTTVSRLQPLKAPAVPTKNNRITVEKPKAVSKLSPVRRKQLSSVGSSEDVLSDKSSIASDVSDSSFNNSILRQNKKPFPAPNKLGLKKPQLKPPTGGAFRKNTSSSSSSQSSMNSSINSSLSSPPGVNNRLNASLNTSINSSRLMSNPSKLALGRCSGVATSLKTHGADLSNGILKSSGAANMCAAGNGNKSSSVSVAHPQTPAGKLQRHISAPNLYRLSMQSKPESAIKGTSCTKPPARIIPTPTTRLKLPQRPEGISPDRSVGKTMQPTTLRSCSEIGSGIAESPPIRPTHGASPTPSISGRSIKRVSALPTSLGRRTSIIPPATPKTNPRSISYLRPSLGLQDSNKSIRKPLVAGAEETKGKRTNVNISPCSSNEDDTAPSVIVPFSLDFSPENKPKCLGHSEKEQPLVCPQSTELLLIDIEVEESDIKVRKPSLFESDSKPLIDLSNTPERSKRIVPLKPANVGQLIDLSSPLINLSPMRNKENLDMDYPLMMF